MSFTHVHTEFIFKKKCHSLNINANTINVHSHLQTHSFRTLLYVHLTMKIIFVFVRAHQVLFSFY